MQRSTEQLTRCSTSTLAEALENVESSGTTQSVSEKIMSVCRNAIRWILILDALLALSVLVLLSILEFGTIPHHQIGFYCNDPKLAFKFTGDTISIVLLIAGSILIPAIVMWIAESLCHPANSYEVHLGCAGSRLKQVSLWYGHYSIGLVTLTFICDVMKVVIGEPRPHFLDTCRPRELENCTNEYVEKYTCTNTVDSKWFVSDSSRSFPSGHSALSVYTTIFIVLYFQTRLPTRTLFLKPWLQCLMCMWGVTCSLTRIGDNRHHWWDVLAGVTLGIIFGVLSVTVPCRNFKFKRNLHQNCGEPLENGQVGFGEKRHEGVKILLNDSNIDIPEGRELKSIAPPWKE